MSGAFGVALVVWLGSGSLLYLLVGDRRAALIALVPAVLAFVLGRNWERGEEKRSEIKSRLAAEQRVVAMHEAAERGDAGAMVALASRARDQGDWDAAYRWYTRAIKEGSIESRTSFRVADLMFWAAEMAEKQGDLKTARKWYKKAAGCGGDHVTRRAELRIEELDQ
jgi:hypothetical protein